MFENRNKNKRGLIKSKRYDVKGGKEKIWAEGWKVNGQGSKWKKNQNIEWNASKQSNCIGKINLKTEIIRKRVRGKKVSL